MTTVVKASGIATSRASLRLFDVIFTVSAHGQRRVVAKAPNKAADAGARGVREMFQQSAVTFVGQTAIIPCPSARKIADDGGSDEEQQEV